MVSYRVDLGSRVLRLLCTPDYRIKMLGTCFTAGRSSVPKTPIWYVRSCEHRLEQPHKLGVTERSFRFSFSKDVAANNGLDYSTRLMLIKTLA